MKLITTASLLLATSVAHAAPPEEEAEDAYLAEVQAFDATLHYQTGTITLPSRNAQLALPEGYRYLDPADADRLLQFWGNPPDATLQGLIAPPSEDPAELGWVVVLRYNDDGHVDDSDAATIDYDEVLAGMKRDAVDDNHHRKQLGLATADLLGWAEPPHYDAATHKIYWAKDLQFSEQDGRTLNYAVRVLGREGILELNAVAMLDELEVVKPEMARMLAFSEFTAGNRYEDYVHGSDRSAGYGVAAVVAGGAVAAKAAGSKGFVALLLAAKKLLVAIGVGIAAFFRAFWSRIRGLFRRKQAVPAADPPPPPPSEV